jgi:photosystem I P700 chlorophyll a apoprotein A2
MLEHKEAIISQVKFIFKFHTLGLYVHNDLCQAFGTPENKF